MHKPDINVNTDYAERQPLPEGTYECEVLAYEIVENPYYKSEPYVNQTGRPVQRGSKMYEVGETVPADPPFMKYQYRFTYRVVEGEFADRWLFDRTSTALSLSDRNKLRNLLGKVIPGGLDKLDERILDGDAPDFDTEVLGMPVVCIVDQKKNKDKTKTFNNVTGYMRSQRQVIAIEDDGEIQWTAE